MFPIRDHNPSERRPFVTYALIAINIVIFFSYWDRIDHGRAMDVFFFNWGLVPGRITSGFGYDTLITSMFLHGSFLHLAGNMLFLWIFGDNLEDEMGHFGFAAFYIAAGLAAAGLQIAADPASPVPMVGASGAIAGVLGGYLLLYPRAKVDVLIIFVIFFRIFTIPAWVVLGLWFALQFFNSASNSADGVAYMAHVGGFIGGLILTVPVWMQRGARGYWARTLGRPPHPAAQYELSPSRIPRVVRRR